MDKVKGLETKEKGGGGKETVMSVEKRCTFIKIKAIPIKMLVLTVKWKRRRKGDEGGGRMTNNEPVHHFPSRG